MDVDEDRESDELMDEEEGGGENEMAQDRIRKGKGPARQPQIQGQGHLYIAVHRRWGQDYQNLTLFLDCGGSQTLISEIVLPEGTNDYVLRETQGQRPEDFPALVASIRVVYVTNVALYRQLLYQAPKHRWDHEECTKYHWIAGVLKAWRENLLGVSAQDLERILFIVQQAYWLAHVFTVDQSGVPQSNNPGGG